MAYGQTEVEDLLKTQTLNHHHHLLLLLLSQLVLYYALLVFILHEFVYEGQQWLECVVN
jgi:hypothetical protein